MQPKSYDKTMHLLIVTLTALAVLPTAVLVGLGKYFHTTSFGRTGDDFVAISFAALILLLLVSLRLSFVDGKHRKFAWTCLGCVAVGFLLLMVFYVEVH